MIRRDICEKKIKEIIDTINALGDNHNQQEYKKVLERQLEGWRKEYVKALMRDE